MVTQGETEKKAEGTEPSQSAAGSTSKEIKVYPEEEYRKAISDALAEQGRKHKIALTKAEKAAQEALEESRTSLESQNAKYKKMLDEIGEDDEDKSRLAKYLKEAEADRKEAAKLKQQWEPLISEAREFRLTNECMEIAGEYGDGSDPVKLERLAKRANLPDDVEERKDALREIAGELWTKAQPKQETTPPRKVDSGINTGITGRRPTYEELRAAAPEVAMAKFASGEWTR